MARKGNINIAEEIKNRCDIVDVVGRTVELKRAGSNYKGLCPFHNEKTPSFIVSKSKQIFKCFGCNASGDVIDFVRRYYNTDFREAAEMLAREYGIDTTGAFGNSENKEELYEINRQAARFFYRGLREAPNPGYKYMRGRGLTDETLKLFKIGYADNEWTSLTDHMVSLGIDREKLVELGLTSKSKGRYYDKFRDRVIFPILNTSGKFIGFGGRIIGQGEPKYLNSPESPIFLKKNNLYGLDMARDQVKEDDEIILVEGYMDVISLYQAGVRNVSASLGTSLTENQASLIKRYTRNVVLSYDADDAGQMAAMRGVDILYDEDITVRVLKVNDGKDPDEYIKKNGRSAFNDLLKNALPYGDFKLDYVGRGLDLSDDQQRLKYMRRAIDVLSAMKPVEADMYVRRLSQKTGISEEAIRRECMIKADRSGGKRFPSGGSGHTAHGDKAGRGYQENGEAVEISDEEKNFIRLMLLDRRFTELPEDIRDEAFENASAREIYKAITEVADNRSSADIDLIKNRLEEDAADVLDNISGIIIPGDKEEIIYEDCIRFVRNKKLRRELEDIMLRLEFLDDSTDPGEIDKLMIRQMEIQRILKG